MNAFIPWIDSVDDINCQTSSAFANDTQRQNGFQAGQPASALRVNSALRQANLVVSALMNVLSPSSTLSLTSNVNDLIAELSTKLTNNLRNGVDDYSVLMSGCTGNFGINVLLGRGLTAGKSNQIIVGKYNSVLSQNACFIIANGTSSTATKNLLVVNEDGSVEIIGKLNVQTNVSASTIECQGLTSQSIGVQDLDCQTLLVTGNLNAGTVTGGSANITGNLNAGTITGGSTQLGSTNVTSLNSSGDVTANGLVKGSNFDTDGHAKFANQVDGKIVTATYTFGINNSKGVRITIYTTKSSGLIVLRKSSSTSVHTSVVFFSKTIKEQVNIDFNGTKLLFYVSNSDSSSVELENRLMLEDEYNEIKDYT